MNRLLSECQGFLKNFGYTYAFCGGYSLELFINKKIRTHADIDISIFDEDKKNIAEFMLSKGWNVFEHKVEWVNHKAANRYLQQIQNFSDERWLNLRSFWAVKPGCSVLGVEPRPGEYDTFNYEILSEEQRDFDFIEIIFNKQQRGMFICDEDKNITRELDKAVLYRDGIPFLAPEVMLFMISDPVYMESEYHREKNQVDFNSVVPFLPEESKGWLIKALETAYPEGHKRIGQLRE